MANSTELVLVRHGEAICNVEGVVGGERGCRGLSARGREQVHSLAKSLAQEHTTAPFDVLIATPRRRVLESAEIVSAAVGLDVVVDADLRGPDHGEADGRPWTAVKAAFGGPPQSDPGRSYSIGGEPWNAYLTRTAGALRTILNRHAGQRVLVVAHGETVESAHTLLLGLPPGACREVRFTVGHASLTRWQRHVNRFGQCYWILDSHNDVSHLHGMCDDNV
ncbi:histidine phosphatase family protein [Nocardia sp. NPDC059246]|uniref:histidine phosphatase family protein n=1 Tax=unclassified Nocardia TaxID=2637762 RepID=UPI0036749F26